LVLYFSDFLIQLFYGHFLQFLVWFFISLIFVFDVSDILEGLFDLSLVFVRTCFDSVYFTLQGLEVSGQDLSAFVGEVYFPFFFVEFIVVGLFEFFYFIFLDFAMFLDGLNLLLDLADFFLFEGGVWSVSGFVGEGGDFCFVVDEVFVVLEAELALAFLVFGFVVGLFLGVSTHLWFN
jgi:hypothetical protein